MNLIKFESAGMTADVEALRKTLNEITKATRTKAVRGKDIILFHVRKKQEKPGKITCDLLAEEYIRDYEEDGRIPIADIPESAIGEELLKEVRSGQKMILSVDGDFYSTDDNILQTLSQRIKLSGDSLSEPSRARNVHIAERLMKRNPKCTMLYREDENGFKKAFALFGSRYAVIPQTVILGVAEKVQEDLVTNGVISSLILDSFFVNHEETWVNYKASVGAGKKCYDAFGNEVEVPTAVGLTLSTSDIGDSSLLGTGYYVDEKGHAVYLGSTPLQHSLKADPKKFVKDIEEKIFPDLIGYPDVLTKLCGIKFEGGVDVFSDLCDLVLVKFKKLGSKSTREAKIALMLEFNETANYTLYDIALDFMSLPDRSITTGMSSVSMNQFRRDAGQVPFFIEKLYEKASKSSITVVA